MAQLAGLYLPLFAQTVLIIYPVIRKALYSIFYPRLCVMCGSYIGEKTQGDVKQILCDTCLRALPRTEQAQMRQNSTETALVGNVSNIVAAAKTMHLDHAAAYLFFEKEHPVRDMIHQMKYAERPEIGFLLGRQAAMEFQYAGFFDGIDVIVPVPLHPNRLRSRGYNQSEYIAQGISDFTGIPVDTTHVTRVKDTPKQALQRGENRKSNVAEAFAVNHPEQLYHKHILVVDDLITTGETMQSCINSMRPFRGATISAFALCKTR